MGIVHARRCARVPVTARWDVRRWVRFDGRFEHEVLPYEGTRYSVIYFQLMPPWSVDPSTTEPW